DYLDKATAAADHVLETVRDELTVAERALWQYGREVIDGIADYIEAASLSGGERQRRGEKAIVAVGEAIEHVRGIDLSLKGTWGAYDIEWMRDLGFNALRRRFGGLDT